MTNKSMLFVILENIKKSKPHFRVEAKHAREAKEVRFISVSEEGSGS